MGIFFYKNAAHGGDWIIQEALSNADWLNALLPPNAPLSTMRVITASTYARSANPEFMAKFNQRRKESNKVAGFADSEG